jgi:hypothetical protein
MTDLNLFDKIKYGTELDSNYDTPSDMIDDLVNNVFKRFDVSVISNEEMTEDDISKAKRILLDIHNKAAETFYCDADIPNYNKALILKQFRDNYVKKFIDYHEEMTGWYDPDRYFEGCSTNTKEIIKNVLAGSLPILSEINVETRYDMWCTANRL